MNTSIHLQLLDYQAVLIYDIYNNRHTFDSVLIKVGFMKHKEGCRREKPELQAVVSVMMMSL